MRLTLSYLKPWYGRMLLGFVIKCTGTIMDLLLPWALAYMIDDIVPQGSFAKIWQWGGVMALFAVAALAGNVIANRMASAVARNAVEQMRYDLFEKTLSLSCAQTDSVGIPTLVSRLTSDTYHVHNMISKMQRLGVRAPILLVGGILVTLTLEPVLTLVLLAVLPLIGGVIWGVSSRGIPRYARLQNRVDALVRTVREDITGIRVIKALSKEAYEKERFDRVNRAATREEKAAAVLMALSNPLIQLFLNAGLTAVILVGAFRVQSGMTQPGKIISFLTYFTIILNAMISITRMFVLYSKGIASADRIGEVLRMPADLPLLSAGGRAAQAHISFSGVSFAYHKPKTVLSDISFAVGRGETLGIIGATGSGKSTIVNLILRLYDADTGTICLAGRDIRTIPKEELYQNIGVVFQKESFLAGTIAQNIDFGRNLSHDTVEQAAKAAQAGEFILSRAEGFSYLLAPGATNLSGGQRQRLAIARALAGEPALLLLDDASSALDYKTDARLRKVLGTAYQDTTKIIVAQRVSSILHAERILYLENGRIAGYGTHKELLAGNAAYREICLSQMGGEAVGL